MKTRFYFTAAAFILLIIIIFNPRTVNASNKRVSEALPIDSAINVKTKYLTVNGLKYGYRRFGLKRGVPLVFIQHLAGTMDNWDPAILDGFAKGREVIIFDNKGVTSSEGKVPDNIAAMAIDAASFTDALGLKKIDLLGFSIGGMVAQQLTLNHPALSGI